MKTKTAKRCSSCEVIYINGVRCHETGCPDAWADETLSTFTRECDWCGSDFTPEDRHQRFCAEDCAESYNN